MMYLQAIVKCPSLTEMAFAWIQLSTTEFNTFHFTDKICFCLL